MITDNFNIDLPDPMDLGSPSQEFDIDGDGVADAWTIEQDLNGDGITDQVSLFHAVDTDGDGNFDSWEISHGIDTDGDGKLDTWENQTDIGADGIIDQISYAQDTDGDGIPDTPYNPDTAYNPEEATYNNDDMIGDPLEDMEHWHEQANPDTCAVVAQEFILDQLTGYDFDEQELRELAYENGWYTPTNGSNTGGTPLYCTGNILEYHGIPVERSEGCTLQDIADKLAQGEKVIVGLDADEVWNPNSPDQDGNLTEVEGIPGNGSNHAVQVIGIDNSDPNNPMVILNDPGNPNGQGLTVPADQFIDAWEDSNHFMVATAINSTPDNSDREMTTMVGGYYNSDETYHWNSYNVDTDVDSGVVVRQW